MRFHKFVKEEGGWRMHERPVAYENPYLEIQVVKCSSPTRPEPFEWTVCHRKGGVAVAAQTEAGGFVMVRQERVPFCSEFWEFPAGQIDEFSAGDWERVVETGLRELKEESGYELGEGGEVVPMHYFCSSPGFTDEHVFMIWVKGVKPSEEGRSPDAGEAILEVRVFGREEIRAMVLRGEIRDANTLCCLARLGALGAI